MATIQYRVKTNSIDEISQWRDTLDNHGLWDYREYSDVRIEYLEVRIKPEFVPGWYVYVDSDAAEHESPAWFDYEFPAWATGAWQRVNVSITPVETD